MPFHPDGLLQVPAGAPVEQFANPALEPDTRNQKQRYKAATKPLFNHPPRIGDVVQGQIGDCYLLAALNSILSHGDGAEIIMYMMKDNKDGTITIRLYPEGVARYFRMDKSIIREYTGKTFGVLHGTGRTLHGEGALWVSLVEKAYLTCRPAGENGIVTYKSIAQGSAGEAAAKLVGNGVKAMINGHQDDAMTEVNQLISDVLEELSDDNRLFTRIPALKQKLLDRAARIFGDESDGHQHANAFAAWNTGEVPERIRQFRRSNPTIEKFLTLMRDVGSTLPQQTLQLLLIFMRNSTIFPHDSGMGRYHPEQLDLFAKIQRHLATQKSVTASTPQNLFGRQTGTGHSAGESKVEGLAANHAYTVMDTRIEDGGLRFICVRNPWGRYGRDYNRVRRGLAGPGEQPIVNMTPVEASEQAESWIELTDFGHNFSVEYSATVHGAARAGLMDDLAGQLQTQKGRLKRTVTRVGGLG